MAVRFKRSYHDRKETIARRRKTIVKVLLIVLSFQIIFSLFAASLKLQSSSMSPVLEKNNTIIYSPFVYGFKIKMFNWQLPQIREPKRGDLVVFTPPYSENISGPFAFLNGFVKFFTFGKINLNSLLSESWDQRLLVKRVIAVPGDTIRMYDYKVSIKPEGSSFFLSEFEVINNDYDIKIDSIPAGWSDDLPFSGKMKAVKLEDNQFFVLGDNRLKSSDSLSWGMLNRDRIEGMVLLKYWPLNQFQIFK